MRRGETEDLEPYRVSVATACYRSEAFIQRTFESILAQKYDNLEWNVIVDGQLDNTLSVIESCRERAPFPINVKVFDVNRGPAAAITASIQQGDSDFTIILDHDDELLGNALKRLTESWHDITATHDPRNLFGVFGRCIDEHGRPLSPELKRTPLVGKLGDLLHVHKCRGEGAVLVRTDLLKRYFHIKEGEKGATNGLIWNRLNREHSAVFTNHIVRRYYTDVPNSMSSCQVIKNPRGVALQALEYLNDNAGYFRNDPVSFLRLLVTYGRNCIHADQASLKAMLALEGPTLRLAGAMALPAAALLAHRDRRAGRIIS